MRRWTLTLKEHLEHLRDSERTNTLSEDSVDALERLRAELEEKMKMVFKLSNGKKKEVEVDELDEEVDRKKMIAAIWKRVSPSDRAGRGDSRRVMVTGSFADRLGKKQYTTVKFADLSDDELKAMFQALKG